jgi:hypothetical protein
MNYIEQYIFPSSAISETSKSAAISETSKRGATSEFHQNENNSKDSIPGIPHEIWGGGGGIPLSSIIDPVTLTTSTQMGGKKSELFIPGGLVLTSIPNKTREYIHMDPFEVPVIDELYDELLDLVSINVSSITKKRTTRKKYA